uniref:(California timema) hypothetical protein n=1 Tax=Timema californicum TaxID=61474 RepID=A0A7R9PA62_TIMCA|nr:unnamed protein product [Timema californicum]
MDDMLDGYLCFVVSICGVGCLTAVIGDVASHFGCTVGLRDAVTAIAFCTSDEPEIISTHAERKESSAEESYDWQRDRRELDSDTFHGWLCFWSSIVWIGFLTAIIGDVATHFGCSINLQDSVTALSIVAMGTSVPDTFASKVAAIQDKYADASVGNVTGSNAVNVFLGIGVAWSIAAIYHACKGQVFHVDPGNMAFSVTIFCSEALVAIFLLVIRRSKLIGGELGGPVRLKWLTGLILFCLWVTYLVLSSLEVYDVIEGF